ncbi:hypothetical protein C7H09_03085 [Marinobacter fuscus]|uniref:Uncharacterized protein n=1 Tax=Marinobacter fuscus TaxID=2109942 RepID=A0A2T1KV99_9GAMM|nr:hypothetical protein C7H09_03085 [Marinobacter fuscus]
MLFATLGLQAIPPLLPPFSAITSLQDGWEPLEFPNIDRHTHYELVVEDGRQVVRATANGSALRNAPPAIVGVAIMTDADNTGEQAAAWYGDLILSRSSSEKLPVL